MKCKIVSKGRCGFANSGQLKFIQNTDIGQGFIVTVQETNSSAYGTNSQTFTRKVSAGNVYQLGCTKVSSASASRSWKILGEQPYTIGDEPDIGQMGGPS